MRAWRLDEPCPLVIEVYWVSMLKVSFRLIKTRSANVHQLPAVPLRRQASPCRRGDEM